MLTTALIGCGSRGSGHASLLKESKSLKCIAVCDIDAERAKACAEKIGVECYTDYKELMKRDDLDTVVIVTDTKTHCEIAMEAVRNGKHFIVEKPLGRSISEAAKLVEEAEKAGIKGMVCYQLRFAPFCEGIKKYCDVIDPVQILISHPRGMMKPQFLNPDPFCGMHDVISHHIDLASFFMGREPTAVYATFRRNTYTDTGAVDNISVCIEYGEGDSVRSANIISSMGGAGIDDLYYVIGAKGYVCAPNRRELLVKKPNSEKPEREELPPAGGDTTSLLYDHFARYVQEPAGSVEERATLKHGLNSLMISLATLESQKTGKKIKLSEFLEASR